jgi:DNA helicase-2/ATP-dependent DNA helicase PcrA
MQSLDAILEKLNPQQLRAVTSIDGPVMVVAGPGTGKTQILSARIAYILTHTDTKPSQILCLTYTEAGAYAMRSRLESMIGPVAYEVRIHTFHSLGADIIRSNEERFGSRGLQPISDLEKEQLLRELITELPSQSLLTKSKDRFYNGRNLQSLFSLIKSENLSPEKLIADAQNFIQEMPEMEEYQYKRAYKTFKKGDPKEGDIRKVSDKLKVLIEALSLFDTYQEKMQAAARFDFDDMLQWVIKAFESDPLLLQYYQEQFEYFLVDEFQDTNGTQVSLLYQLAGYWEKPNLFVVGDDDQSIYKFQGANVGNIIDFAHKYLATLTTVVLTENYRSAQTILDAAASLIQHNNERLTKQLNLDKNLRAANTQVATLPQKPLLMEFPNTSAEAANVVAKIKELLAAGTPPAEIAVLYRNHNQAEEVARFLSHESIPVYAVRAVDVLAEPIVQNLLLVMQYIQQEKKEPFSGEYLLFELLHFPYWNLQPIEIARLSFAIKESKKAWRQELQEITERVGNNKHAFDTHSVEYRLSKVHQDLEYWIANAANVTVSELAEKIIAKAGFLSVALKGENKTWNVQVLKTFFDFIKDETARKPYLSLGELLDTLSLMKTMGIGLEIKRVLGASSGVKLLTAHASKGLEFDYVFLIGAVNGKWKEKGDRLPFGLSVIFSKQNKEEGTAEEEARRLFYVALTRAKKGLFVSWHTENENPAKFVSELKETETCTTDRPQVEESVLLSFLESQLMGETATPSSALQEEEWIDRFLASYKMSVTHLNQYLQCPVSFYYDKVLRVPTAKNKHAGFGSAIHYTLEAWLRAAKEEPQRQFWELDKIEKEFEKQMYNQRASFTKEDYPHLLAQGKAMLTQYVSRRAERMKTVMDFMPEQRFAAVFEGLPLTGMADKVELLSPQSAVLVDFKTGNPDRGRKKLVRPDTEATEADSFESRMGGDYWRQLVFYKLLTELDPHFSATMEYGEVDFIEAEEEEGSSLKLYVTEEDTEQLKTQIRQAAAGIQNKEFDKGCGEKECRWCAFEKYYLNRNS